MTAGYSGTPLAKKLGIADGATVVLAGAPPAWSLPDPPPGIAVKRSLRGPFDVGIVFVRSAAELRRRAGAIARATPDGSSVWIAWPRKAGGHTSDVSETLLREVLLPTGLVDVKVAALDDDWSGLKFVRRKELRAKR